MRSRWVVKLTEGAPIVALLYDVACSAELVRVCLHNCCTLLSNRCATQRTSKQPFNAAPPKAKFNPDMWCGRWATVYQQCLDSCRKEQGRTTNIWQPFTHPKAHKSSPQSNVCFAGGECLHLSHCFHWGHHRRQKSVVSASSFYLSFSLSLPTTASLRMYVWYQCSFTPITPLTDSPENPQSWPPPSKVVKPSVFLFFAKKWASFSFVFCLCKQWALIWFGERIIWLKRE